MAARNAQLPQQLPEQGKAIDNILHITTYNILHFTTYSILRITTYSILHITIYNILHITTYNNYTSLA